MKGMHTMSSNSEILVHLVLTIILLLWRRGSLMASALGSGLSGLGSRPGLGHCILFLGKTLYSHSASLHQGVQIVTGELNAGGNPAID